VDDRFCGSCGATIGDEAVNAEAELNTNMTGNNKRSNLIWLIAAITSVLALAIAYYWLFLRDDLMTSNAVVRPAATVENSEATVTDTPMFARAHANVRDRETSIGTNIVTTVERGEVLSGKIILGEDGTSSWLKLADGRGFIGISNLSANAPPPLSKSLNGKIWSSTDRHDIFAEPDRAANILGQLAIGNKVTLSGVTKGDWLEIKMPKGGVGYLPEANALLTEAIDTAKPLPPAIALRFDPANCAFGGEFQPLFEKLFRQAQARSKVAETSDYPNADARAEALGKLAEKGIYLPLNRSYKGLTVTGIGQHLESQSIYFAEPISDVIGKLRDAGFSIARDGTIAGGDTFSSGVFAVSGQGSKLGRTELSCGV
jgi:hypothetical protein